VPQCTTLKAMFRSHNFIPLSFVANGSIVKPYRPESARADRVK
jgi:hypothetical protein